jgi:diaminohydroxyphosphoribosylaminopyrimidine deaminase/5-amino-6-(5-phosphoribosylamino)uracil reductase
VGSGTLLADDPRLDRRLGLAAGHNVRVVLDRRLRTPPDARLFTIEGPVVIYTQASDPERVDALKARGAEVVVLPAVEPGTVLADLHGRGVQSLLVEGGAEILASFVAAGCYDRVMVDCAPLLIGGKGAPGPLAGEGFAELDNAARLENFETRKEGGDLILTAYRKGCLEALSTAARSSSGIR